MPCVTFLLQLGHFTKHLCDGSSHLVILIKRRRGVFGKSRQIERILCLCVGNRTFSLFVQARHGYRELFLSISLELGDGCDGIIAAFKLGLKLGDALLVLFDSGFTLGGKSRRCVTDGVLQLCFECRDFIR